MKTLDEALDAVIFLLTDPLEPSNENFSRMTKEEIANTLETKQTEIAKLTKVYERYSTLLQELSTNVKAKAAISTMITYMVNRASVRDVMTECAMKFLIVGIEMEKNEEEVKVG